MLLHVMLTVAAIVQGVAFTEVVQSGEFQMLRLGLVMNSDDWLRIIQVTGIFGIVAVVWFGQVVNCVGYSLWPRPYFGFLDALFPFAFGGIEVKLAHSLPKPDVFSAWLCGFYGLLLLAWWDFYRKLNQRIAENNESFGALEHARHVNVWSAWLLCPLFFALSWYTFTPNWSRFVLFGGVVVLDLVTALSLRRIWDDRKLAPAVEHHIGALKGDTPGRGASQTPERPHSVTVAAALLGFILGFLFTRGTTPRTTAHSGDCVDPADDPRTRA